MYSPSSSLVGRDLIAVRLMSRSANSCRRRTRLPGSSWLGRNANADLSLPVGSGQLVRSNTKRVAPRSSSSMWSRSARRPYVSPTSGGAIALQPWSGSSPPPLCGRGGERTARGPRRTRGLLDLHATVLDEARALHEAEGVAGHALQRRFVSRRAIERERHRQDALTGDHAAAGLEQEL